MPMKQTEKMRELYEKFRKDKELVIRKYASAEESGEVARESNTYGLSSLEYSRRLYYNLFERKR
jgi:hypothetical protein